MNIDTYNKWKNDFIKDMGKNEFDICLQLLKRGGNEVHITDAHYETGKDGLPKWAVVITSFAYWIGRFKTKKEAVKFCKNLDLKVMS
jgi:hypothetical protein